MEYMKLIKLLYNIDREALRRWARPVTFDDYYSMPHGLIVSNTLDKAERDNQTSPSYWDNFIKTDGYDNHLINECGDDDLSPIEIRLITELDEKYKVMSGYDMGREHHDPRLFPEYEDPGESSIALGYRKLLKKLGFSNEAIAIFLEDMEELSLLEELV